MEILKQLRKERGLTQTEVANFLGITVSAYGNYELGQRQPTPETLVKLADFFEVSVDYLLGRVDEKDKKIAPTYKGKGLEKYVQLLEKAGITEEKLSLLTVEDINLLIAYAKGLIDSKRNSK